MFSALLAVVSLMGNSSWHEGIPARKMEKVSGKLRVKGRHKSCGDMVVFGGREVGWHSSPYYDDMSLSGVSAMFFLDVLFSLFYVYSGWEVPWIICPMYDGSLKDVSRYRHYDAVIWPFSWKIRQIWFSCKGRKPSERQKTNEMRDCA